MFVNELQLPRPCVRARYALKYSWEVNFEPEVSPWPGSFQEVVTPSVFYSLLSPAGSSAPRESRNQGMSCWRPTLHCMSAHYIMPKKNNDGRKISTIHLRVQCTYICVYTYVRHPFFFFFFLSAEKKINASHEYSSMAGLGVNLFVMNITHTLLATCHLSKDL